MNYVASHSMVDMQTRSLRPETMGVPQVWPTAVLPPSSGRLEHKHSTNERLAGLPGHRMPSFCPAARPRRQHRHWLTQTGSRHLGTHKMQTDPTQSSRCSGTCNTPTSKVQQKALTFPWKPCTKRPSAHDRRGTHGCTAPWELYVKGLMGPWERPKGTPTGLM